MFSNMRAPVCLNKMQKICLILPITQKEVCKFVIKTYSTASVSRDETVYDPTYPRADKHPKWLSAREAVEAGVKSGDHVYVHGIAATPTPLLNCLCRNALEKGLENIVLWHLHLEGEAQWAQPDFKGTTPEIPWLFRRKIVDLDVALIHVSPPDKHGFCTLGTSVDATRSAIINAKLIIALANPKMPRTIGDGVLHSSHIDTMVFYDGDLHERKVKPGSDIERGIGTKVAEELVEDGATLQMGIGAIPDAALAALKDHKRLGIHTEMFSDGVLDLVNCGAITNQHKYVHPGKIVTSFVYGSHRLYKFLHDNPMLYMGDITWVNDPAVIRKNPKVTAINSAVEVDITGQIVSDSIGTRIISGFGGQVDFIRGASFCNDGRGKPIIALPSVTNKGIIHKLPY